MHLRIETSRRLSGDYLPQGNKNEALPVVAACLMCPEACELDNLPQILDVDVMLELVRGLGAEVEVDAANHKARIHAHGMVSTSPDAEMATRIRGSLLLAAPMLARSGSAVLQRPGGDRIGRRRIDPHLEILEKMGAHVEMGPRAIRLELDKGFQACELFLEEASVMATETALMAAAVAHGTTVIDNAACEPHVQQLGRLLAAMGAGIDGLGTNRITICGTGGAEHLHGVTHRLLEDHIEVGSIIALAAATGSAIRIPGVTPNNYRMVQRVFSRLGVRFMFSGDTMLIPEDQELRVDYDRNGAIPHIHDAPWPGFPADLSSIAVVLACCAEGSVLIHEWMFESRLYWVDSLISMGARITQCDPHRVVVDGGRPLYSATLSSPDIRAGMSLLIAALRAEGVTRIHNAQQIDRGYERIDLRLAELGAKVQRVRE